MERKCPETAGLAPTPGVMALIKISIVIKPANLGCSTNFVICPRTPEGVATDSDRTLY